MVICAFVIILIFRCRWSIFQVKSSCSVCANIPSDVATATSIQIRLPAQAQGSESRLTKKIAVMSRTSPVSHLLGIIAAEVSFYS